MQGHYLLIIVTEGKSFERVYWPLDSVEEEPRQALARWIESQVEATGRVRKLDTLRDQIRATVEGYRICRPTSWHRERAEAEGRKFPSLPLGMKAKRRR